MPSATTAAAPDYPRAHRRRGRSDRARARRRRSHTGTAPAFPPPTRRWSQLLRLLDRRLERGLAAAELTGAERVVIGENVLGRPGQDLPPVRPDALLVEDRPRTGHDVDLLGLHHHPEHEAHAAEFGLRQV